MVSCKSQERQTTFVEVVGKHAYPVFSINRQTHKNSWLSTFQTYVAFVDFLFRIQDWETFPISWWTDGRFLSFLKIVSKWRDVGGRPGVATFPNLQPRTQIIAIGSLDQSKIQSLTGEVQMRPC